MLRAALLAAAAGALLTSSVNAQTTISNTRAGDTIAAFGSPDTRTYGQVFTAPITGFLTSFSLSLNGGVGSLFGGVGTWSGPSTFAQGFGSPTNLYQSANVQSSGAQTFSFAPNVGVVAGNRYVAYLSTFGVAEATGTTTMPTGTQASGINYFVFNNTTDPRGNSGWNYFGDRGSVQFSATFAPAVSAAVPEPATWAMMLAGFGMMGFAIRRRRPTVSATARVA